MGVRALRACDTRVPLSVIGLRRCEQNGAVQSGLATVLITAMRHSNSQSCITARHSGKRRASQRKAPRVTDERKNSARGEGTFR